MLHCLNPIVYCVNPHVLVDKPKLHLLICVYTDITMYMRYIYIDI